MLKRTVNVGRWNIKKVGRNQDLGRIRKKWISLENSIYPLKDDCLVHFRWCIKFTPIAESQVIIEGGRKDCHLLIVRRSELKKNLSALGQDGLAHWPRSKRSYEMNFNGSMTFLWFLIFLLLLYFGSVFLKIGTQWSR